MTTPRLVSSAPRAALVALSLAGLVTACAVTRTAQADDVSGAANAFSRAQKAELSGDFAAAAELYELADSLAPAPEALRSALRARKSAGQLETAAVHAEELNDRYPADVRSTELAKATLDEAAKKLMRFEIACRPAACTIQVDGAAADADAKEKHIVYLTPGKHEMRAAFGTNRSEPQAAEGVAGDRGSLAFDAPPEPPPRSPDAFGVAGPTEGAASTADHGVQRHHGLSPWFFAGGAVVTAGLGAATIWSGLDVISAHDAYKKNQTLAGYNDGKSRELRTNLLIAGTAVTGAATAVLAFLTDWHGKQHDESALSPGVHAAASVTSSSAALMIDGVY